MVVPTAAARLDQDNRLNNEGKTAKTPGQRVLLPPVSVNIFYRL
jgi:hypothetical protein